MTKFEENPKKPEEVPDPDKIPEIKPEPEKEEPFPPKKEPEIEPEKILIAPAGKQMPGRGNGEHQQQARKQPHLSKLKPEAAPAEREQEKQPDWPCDKDDADHPFGYQCNPDSGI